MDKMIFTGNANDLYDVHKDKTAESVSFVNDNDNDTTFVCTITSYNDKKEHKFINEILDKKLKITVEILDESK